MGSQQARLGVFGAEVLGDEVGPQPSCGPHLGDFHVKVHAHAPEEGKAWREVVDVQAGLKCCIEKQMKILLY